MSYAKLFSSITESSLWSEPKEVRLLFVTMLAKANSIGFMEASVLGLARVSNLTEEETVSSLSVLESPDPHSKNPELEGRRIMKVPGGWMILNYEDYRSRTTEEERKEYMREYMRKYRAEKAGKQSVNNVKESKDSPSASSSSLSVRKEKSTEKGKPTDLAEVIEFLKDQSMAVEFFDYYQSNGWHVGRNPMRDWRAAARRWQRNQKQTPVLSGFQKPKYVDPNQQKLDDEYEQHRREREARKYGANSATTN